MTFPHALGVPGGGTEDCVQTALHLHASGARVVLVSVVSHTISRFPRPKTTGELLGLDRIAELRSAGIEVVTVPQNRWHYLLDGLSVRRAVRRILRGQRVDALLGWHHEVAFLPRLLRAHKTTFGMIASNGHYEQWYNAARGIRAAVQHLAVIRQMRQAEVIFARSVFMGGLITELFALNTQRIHVAYCGIDPAFTELQRVSSSELTRFLFVGWFVHEKGIFDTLKALGQLAAKGEKNWTLKIAGWGDEAPVRRLAGEYGISDRIVFTGKLSRAGLCRELTWAQLAILPSYAESFGLAVAESQFAGLPVVGYDVGGVPEIVEHGHTGWLVPAGDVDALAGTIQAAIREPEAAFRMGLAGRKRVSARFSWAETGQTMLSVLKSARAAETSKTTTHEPKLEHA